jgi:hypothetical protein
MNLTEPTRAFLFVIQGDEKFDSTLLTSYARKVECTPKTITITTMIAANLLDYYKKFKLVNQHFVLKLLRSDGNIETELKFNKVKLKSLKLTCGHSLNKVLFTKIVLTYDSFDIIGNTELDYTFNLKFQSFAKDYNANV